MKDKIYATLNKEHVLDCSTIIIGRAGENDISVLEITLDESLSNYWFYLDFAKSDGSTYKTAKLEVVQNNVTYEIPNALLSERGSLAMQAVLQNEDGEVWKSTLKRFTVKNSINATDDIPDQDDFITEVQKVLNEIEEGLTPSIGENGNWFILDKDTGKPARGEQGIEGPKGDAGSIKFIVVNELPIEDIDESAIYMKATTNQEEQNIYEEYIYVSGEWELLGNAKVEVNLDEYQKTEELDSKELLITYEDNTTETVKLVVYK